MKHRESQDRTIFYGNAGRYRSHFYVYIISAETTKLVKFLALSMNYSVSEKVFGKTPLPVKFDSCYKMTFNGDGIANSTFSAEPQG